MDWLKAIQYTLTQIEARISEPDLGIEILAGELFISPPHLQRAFSTLTQLSLSEYIRNRRLTLAAAALQEGQSIIETALQFGYETPESFTKAFKRFHGVTPSEAKAGNVALTAFPPLQIQLTLKGESPMNYKLIEKPGFTLVGTSIEVSTEHGENMVKIPAFWNEINQNGTMEKIIALPGIKELTGACIMDDLKATVFTYAAAGLFESPFEAPGFTTWTVGPQTWAIFEVVGQMPQSIQEVWQRIFAEWFPATGFEHANAPELEIYPPGDTTAPDYRCEIWIPVVKK